MREKRTIQSSIFEQYAEHEIGHELKAMSDWLDRHPELLDWVDVDLRSHPVMATGRKGLTTDSVLRCAILKQYRQLSYDDLTFCLLDSLVLPDFCPAHAEKFAKKIVFAKCDQCDFRCDLGADQSAPTTMCLQDQNRER